MKINGAELAVEAEGAGPAVLMVHGLGGTSNFYQVQAQALAERFRVIRVDSAGAGRSGLRDGISIESHADDLAAVLDAFEADAAAVVAHSMGTLVARAFAARHPRRATALALLGAVAEPADAGRQAQRDRAAVLRGQGTAAVAPGVVANALSETTRRDKPEVAAFVRELVMRQDPEGYARNCEALAAATDPGAVPADLPLLLITGSDDKVGPPAVSQALAAAHGDATVSILPGVGHWTALEAAADTTDQLTKFL
ncbi:MULTISPECIES: alpha/beta fold hydrolase [Amycolatopsis]|uniref:Alpha/beta fold hydrolase n=1 Tax=Amycolatopsis dendrobii TaxID=2760662 RepID=A0A7W3W0G0_9PSEU|nr:MULTISPECIES: alpha/beta hydrolase [Amycolatopsis]MBB1156082.1 alpha/beta fold hydrolase [Amycolatopsis dendrobii]UKD58609.1 alpha/beta hydrolase [Amycolatopsis sp. FU40]